VSHLACKRCVDTNTVFASTSLLDSIPSLFRMKHDPIIVAPLTPALLRLDPMFDPLQNDPRFQKLCEEKQK
jgi:hypothetical protein